MTLFESFSVVMIICGGLAAGAILFAMFFAGAYLLFEVKRWYRVFGIVVMLIVLTICVWCVGQLL